MPKSKERPFLQKQQSQIIKKINSPIELADVLYEDNFISTEVYSKIKNLQTSHDQMREIYLCLNNNKACERAYEWMKENEPDLLEDLEKTSKSEYGPPDEKRPRSQSDKAMDETDNLNSSNLKTFLKEFNTFAKLEKWVSDPKNNQSVIDKLKKKLAKGEMEALEKQLKDKKLKKCLCFNDNDVTKINSDRSLQPYLEATKDAKFPVKLTLSMLFEKNRGYASPVNDFPLEDDSGSYIDDDESTDVHDNDLFTSGYGSVFSTSLNIDQPQNNDQFLFDTEKKSSESPAKNVPGNESMNSQVIQGETSGHSDTETLNTGPPPNNVAASAPVQYVGLQDVHESKNCPLTKVAETVGPPQTPAIKHAESLAYNHGQNEPSNQQQPDINDEMPLDKSIDKQESAENHCRILVGDLCQKEPFDRLDKTSDIGSAPREEAMDFEVGLEETNMHFDTATLNTEQFSSSTPVQSLGLQDKHKSQNYPEHADVLPVNLGQNKPVIQLQAENNDDTPLHKSIGTQESVENHCFTQFEKTDMPPQRSDLKKQTNRLDHEICPNEPTVPLTNRHFDTETLNAGPPLYSVAADVPVQNVGLTLRQNEPFIQQQPEINDDLPLEKSTDKQESAGNHCFSEYAKTRPLDKTSGNDATTAEEAMDTEVSLDETNRHFDTETRNTEQFPSSTSVVLADAPVQNFDLDKHKSENCDLNKADETDGPPQTPADKHIDSLAYNLGKNEPFIQQQPEINSDMPLDKSIGMQESTENNCRFLSGDLCQKEPFDQLAKTSYKEATSTEEAMDTEISLGETNRHLDTETLNTEHISANTLAVVAVTPLQNVGLQDKHNCENIPLTNVAGTDGSSHTSIPEHADVLPGNLGQHKPFNQLQAEKNSDTRLMKIMDMQENVCEPNESTPVVMKGQTDVQAAISSEPGQSLPSLSGQEQRSFSSTPLNGSKQRKDDRKKLLTQNKLKKKKDRDSMFKSWAMEKCSGNSEGGLKKEYFSIINIAEHDEYRFLVAEKVWVYENPEKDEQQIIVFSNEKKSSSRTKILAHYQMFVCGIVNAVILGQEKKEIGLDISKVPELIDRCLKFLSEAFVPALAVYKNMQRTNELDPLL